MGLLAQWSHGIMVLALDFEQVVLEQDYRKSWILLSDYPDAETQAHSTSLHPLVGHHRNHDTLLPAPGPIYAAATILVATVVVVKSLKSSIEDGTRLRSRPLPTGNWGFASAETMTWASRSRSPPWTE